MEPLSLSLGSHPAKVTAQKLLQCCDTPGMLRGTDRNSAEPPGARDISRGAGMSSPGSDSGARSDLLVVGNHHLFPGEEEEGH